MAARTAARTAASTNGRVSNNAANDVGGTLTIPRMKLTVVEVPIDGVTPLIVHQWSEKAKQQMLDKQMKKANKAKEAKDPEQCYHDSLYISTEGWYGVPVGGLKAALVGACRFVDGLPMTIAKRGFFVLADGRSTRGQDLIRINGEPNMREDMVRLDTGVADIRYRGEFKVWSASVRIQFVASMFTEEQVVNLLEIAGVVEGMCEHRPSSPKNATGDKGRWRVDRTKEIKIESVGGY